MIGVTLLIHAIIDIGSNTVRMAIYQIDSGRIEMLMKKKHMVGLAAYLKNGEMQQQGIDKLCEVLAEFKEFLASFRITDITAFTTAALRNAKNSQEAVQQIVKRTGIDVRVISGDEEAVFDFIGATHNLQDDSGLLIDIGGASTEVVFYRKHEIVEKTSLLMGSLSFHTKYVEDILPSTAEIEDMRTEAQQIIEEAEEFANVSEAHICGVGGTFKGALALYNEMYHQERGNKVMDAEKLRAIIQRFTRDNGMQQQDTVILLKTVPERLNTIIPGLVIADVWAQRFASHTIAYSDSGVREGYIYDQILAEKAKN